MSEYKDPVDDGHTLIKVNKKEWNSLFKYDRMKISWKNKLEIYHHPDKGFLIQRIPRLWQKAYVILVYPVVLLIEGIANYKEMNRDVKKILFPKKYGGFSKDVISSKSDIYNELLETIKK